jgi:hypothetical protein
MTALTDPAAPKLYREHDPAAEVRVGPDLIVMVCRADAGHDRWFVVAFDNDGNYLSTLATVHGAAVADPVLTAALDTAQRLYPDHAGLVEYRVEGT